MSGIPIGDITILVFFSRERPGHFLSRHRLHKMAEQNREQVRKMEEVSECGQVWYRGVWTTRNCEMYYIWCFHASILEIHVPRYANDC